MREIGCCQLSIYVPLCAFCRVPLMERSPKQTNKQTTNINTKPTVDSISPLVPHTASFPFTSLPYSCRDIYHDFLCYLQYTKATSCNLLPLDASILFTFLQSSYIACHKSARTALFPHKIDTLFIHKKYILK